MATWLYPPAFEETFRCDYCECDFSEDDLTETSRNVWLCTDCLIEEARNEAGLREMADDDKAHAMRDRQIGL